MASKLKKKENMSIPYTVRFKPSVHKKLLLLCKSHSLTRSEVLEQLIEGEEL